MRDAKKRRAAHAAEVEADLQAALSLEAQRARIRLEKARAQNNYDQAKFELMKHEAILLAYDSDLMDINIKIAANTSSESRAHYERLTKENEHQYFESMEAIQAEDDDHGMPFDPILIASSPLSRFNAAGPAARSSMAGPSRAGPSSSRAGPSMAIPTAKAGPNAPGPSKAGPSRSRRGASAGSSPMSGIEVMPFKV